MEYLDWLLELREALIARIWDEHYSRAQIMASMGALAKELQQACIAGKPMPDITDIMQRHNNDGILEIPAAVTDQMLTNGFYHWRLRQTSPRLYSLCRYYFRLFDGLTMEQADVRAGKLREQLHAENPSLDDTLRGYLVYHLLTDFLEVYEDYSFVRRLAGAMMHMHILELLLALHYEQEKSLSVDSLALLISIYERRGRHNDDVLQGMYEKFYPVLDSASGYPAP
jgi:hypothetical protein